jgi:hypothetical protein
MLPQLAVDPQLDVQTGGVQLRRRYDHRAQRTKGIQRFP